MTPEELAAEVMRLGDGSYRQVRVLPDGSVAALTDLAFTRAIILDCDLYGWGSRFCFADRALADQRFAELQSADDTPAGFIARGFGVGPVHGFTGIGSSDGIVYPRRDQHPCRTACYGFTRRSMRANVGEGLPAVNSRTESADLLRAAQEHHHRGQARGEVRDLGGLRGVGLPDAGELALELVAAPFAFFVLVVEPAVLLTQALQVVARFHVRADAARQAHPGRHDAVDVHFCTRSNPVPRDLLLRRTPKSGAT
jgi:hypothetical protein